MPLEPARNPEYWARRKARRQSPEWKAKRRPYFIGYRLRRRYGLTTAERDGMAEEQGGACAICRRVAPLVIDHDHSTGTVRGLLCHGCNVAIAQADADPAWLGAAAAYLESQWSKCKPA